MKYLFCVAICVLLYAVVGIVTYGPASVAVAKAAEPVVVKPPPPTPLSPTSFQIIRVVEDRAPQSPTAPVVRADRDTSDLTVEIQRRLAEANCYSGADDGVWSERTQYAARRFIAAAHAEMASDHPDDGLLALLRSRGDDKSLCSTAAATDVQAATTDNAARNADAMAEIGQPMGLGAANSTGYSYYSSRGEDHAFRHPLGGF